MRAISALFLSLFLLSAGPARAGAVPPADVYAVTATAETIRIDGVLDEPVWESAWSTELGFEVRPGENSPAPVRTVVMLTYDRDALYVGFRAYDPDPAAIRAHMTDRDNAWGDDWIGVVLDTFNDQRRNFLLLVNPLGVQMDNIELTNADTQEWDGIWHSAARITTWGWSAEFKVPFSSLSFQRADGDQTWGFDAIRGYPRTIFRQMGAFPRDRNNNCYLCQAIKISGFADVQPGRNVELVPTITGTGTTEWDTGSATSARSADAGLSGRWGVTPNLTFSGAVNPDFSQVEADALQLDVNEPFALSYPEKRPFFMEASDFFSTPLNAVYTRSLRDPDWGAKLTGKIARETVGAFVVRDAVTNLILPGNQGSGGATLAASSTASVFRYKHDVGTDYTFGAMATLREAPDYYNRLAGFDARLRFTPKDRVSVQWLGSATRYPDAIVDGYGQPRGGFSDWAGTAAYTRSGRNFYANADYTSVGRNFRADLGFMPRVDYRRAHGIVQYSWLPGNRTWFTNISVSADAYHDETQRGDFLLRNAVAIFNYQGPLQSHVSLQLGRKREAYGGQLFDQTTFYVHNCSTPSGSTEYSVNLWVGDRVDYANVRPGRRTRVQVGLGQRLGRHLAVSLSPTWERITVQPGRLYTARLADLKVSYQFTARMFLRTILQYSDYDYASELYRDGRDDRDRRMFAQVLFSYKVNPRTLLFLGYSDTRLDDERDVLVRQNRTVFMKIGYAWTF